MAKQTKEAMLGEEKEPNKQGGFPWLRASLFVLVCFAVVVPFTSVPEKMRDYARDVYREKNRKQPVKEVIKEVRVEVPVEKLVLPEELPSPKDHVVKSGGDIRKMSSEGFTLKTQVNVEKAGLASAIRKESDSYVADYTLSVKLPKAAQSLQELSAGNEYLGNVLPGLKSMLAEAEVSRFFYHLYENKTNRLKKHSTKLYKLLSQHNFYDCETILNLSHPETKRRVLLVQAEMDVVSDGSDGDRMPTMPDKIVNSTHYQPFTSYGWKKTTRTPNPMVAGWKKRIQNAKDELADPNTKKARADWLKERMKYLKRGVEDMEARSFLIAEYDPFIVMPVNMLTFAGDRHAARVGDYAVVIYGDKIYPAIVGDGGPTFKVGEASLRMAKELNANASPYSRPVSDLKVTYLVFSGSADKKKSAPDYAKWHQKCSDLLTEIGGLGDGYELHQWSDLLGSEE